MNKMNLTCLIITIIALITSIVALALGIIAVTDKNDTKIAGAYEIGLEDLLDGNVVQMKYNGVEPTHRVEFMDEEILNELREALRVAVYQKTKYPKYKGFPYIGNGPGSNLQITTTKSIYYISPTIITINGESICYNNTMSHAVAHIMEKTYNKLFNENDNIS